MADEEDAHELRLLLSHSARAFTLLSQSHNALLDALTELIPGFVESYQKHFDVRRSDETDVATGVELERADAAILDALQKLRSRWKNHP
jgi:hypothetical protein